MTMGQICRARRSCPRVLGQVTRPCYELGGSQGRSTASTKMEVFASHNLCHARAAVSRSSSQTCAHTCDAIKSRGCNSTRVKTFWSSIESPNYCQDTPFRRDQRVGMTAARERVTRRLRPLADHCRLPSTGRKIVLQTLEASARPPPTWPYCALDDT